MDTNTLETNQINEAGLTEEDARNLRIREIERSIIKNSASLYGDVLQKPSMNMS